MMGKFDIKCELRIYYYSKYLGKLKKYSHFIYNLVLNFN